jgi:hypothetical protein
MDTVTKKIYYRNMGTWRKARKPIDTCAGGCVKSIKVGDRYWDDIGDGGHRKYCEYCATMIYEGRGKRLMALAHRDYNGELIDYLGNGDVMVTPKEARDLDQGIVSEYAR